MVLGETEAPFLEPHADFHVHWVPEQKQGLHGNLGLTWLQFLEDLLGKQG